MKLCALIDGDYCLTVKCGEKCITGLFGSLFCNDNGLYGSLWKLPFRTKPNVRFTCPPLVFLIRKASLQNNCKLMESHARVLESLNLILNTWLFLEIRITRVLLLCRRSWCRNLRSLNLNCFLSLSWIYLILSLNVELLK